MCGGDGRWCSTTSNAAVEWVGGSLGVDRRRNGGKSESGFGQAFILTGASLYRHRPGGRRRSSRGRSHKGGVREKNSRAREKEHSVIKATVRPRETVSLRRRRFKPRGNCEKEFEKELLIGTCIKVHLMSQTRDPPPVARKRCSHKRTATLKCTGNVNRPQWCLSGVNAQSRFPCKNVRNTLCKDTSIRGRTVEELRETPQELVACIIWGKPQVGAQNTFCCQERLGANRHDG